MPPLRSVLGLTAIFMTAFLFFMIMLMPASVVTLALPDAADNEDALPRPQLSGLWWRGQGDMEWQGKPLQIRWEMDWRWLTPGVQLALHTGQINAEGWIGADWGDWSLQHWRAQLPVDLINDFLPQGQADGNLDLALTSLSIRENTIAEATGTLRYHGGLVSLGPGMEMPLPPLEGVLAMTPLGPALSVTGPESSSLAHAQLEGKTLTLQVFRALPLLLGMGEEGNAKDVVFSTQQELSLPDASAG
ncbi:MAG: type II secretion system protein N [Pseudomonadota bacterium]|nr:type II secretion system protein N [Pseudomonadota bacterium]